MHARLQIILYVGQYHIEVLQYRQSYLSGAVEGQYSAADYTRHLIKVTLAANRLVGLSLAVR